MREESERVHVEFKNMECRFRIDQMQDVACSFRYSLPHPHDFSPSTADLCWIPEVRKAIVDGTDEEFQIRETEIRSRIPELSTTWLEERRRVFLKLLPQDSPSLEHLSLATTLFDCMKCREFGMRIEDALSHACEYRHDDEFFAKFSSINSANIFYYDVGAPWDSGLAKYRYSAKLSAIVREIVLGCGEDPDTITTKEMNRKHHRFAFFDADGPISVLSWFQAVSYRARIPKNTVPDLLPTASPSTGANGGIERHIASSGLMNYRSMSLTWMAEVANGIASGVGEQGNPKWSAHTSVSSKITLLTRKFVLMMQACWIYGATFNVGGSVGTKSRIRLKKITPIVTRIMPSRSDTDRRMAPEHTFGPFLSLVFRPGKGGFNRADDHDELC